MDKKPIIGIVSRAESEDGIYVTSVMESYRKAIIINGGIPIAILPTQLIEYGQYKSKEVPQMSDEEKEMLCKQLNFCDGIMMPGGINRYEYDFYITNYCISQNVPVLGICLGMQLLATINNRDTLKIIDESNTHLKPQVDNVHSVKLNTNSKLYEIIGTNEFVVNSRHRYKVMEVGDFSIVGYAPDGVIEAIENENCDFAIGVQWHPENLIDTTPSKRLFKSFVGACSNYANKN